MKKPTSKTSKYSDNIRLVRRIKYMIATSKRKIKSPDPITAYRAKIERDCATKILGFAIELTEIKKTSTQTN